MKIGKFSILTVLFIFTNCYIIPCNFDSDLEPLKQKPIADSIIGRYKPDSETLENIREYRLSKNASFLIEANGTFKMFDLPAKTFTLNTSYDQPKTINARGRWKLVESRGAIFIALDIVFNENNFNLTKLGTSWKLYIKNNHLVLFDQIGDPDECQAVRFVKS